MGEFNPDMQLHDSDLERITDSNVNEVRLDNRPDPVKGLEMSMEKKILTHPDYDTMAALIEQRVNDNCSPDFLLSQYLHYSQDKNNKSSKFYNEMGRIFMRKAWTHNAIKSFEHSMILQPDNPDPIFNLASIYKEEKCHNLAVILFAEYLKLKPYSDQASSIYEYIKSNRDKATGKLQIAQDNLERMQ